MGKSVLILLDTHIVLWLAFDAARLSKKAKTTIEEARQSGEGVAISDITLLELAMLARKKRILLGLSLGSFLSEVERRFVVLPMNGHICVRAFALPSTYPKDPADRVIAATALVQGLSLVTADREIRQSHAVPTIW
jgi:PIN domain nuclease of toxin-antitoxin system